VRLDPEDVDEAARLFLDTLTSSAWYHIIQSVREYRQEAEDLAADVSERKAIDQERFGEPTGHYEKGRWHLVPMDDIGLYFRLERND